MSVFLPTLVLAWTLIRRFTREKGALKTSYSHRSVVAITLSFGIGAFTIILPIAFLVEDGIAGILTAMYYVLGLITLQLTAVGEMAVLDGMGSLGYAYYCVLEFYRIIAPLLTLTAAASILLSRIPFLRIKILRSALPSKKQVYAFFGFNRKAYMLAKSIMIACNNPYFVFFNVSQRDKDAWSTELQELKDLFGSRIIIAAEGIDTIALKPSCNIDELTYLIISDDDAKNVSTTLRIRDKIAHEFGSTARMTDKSEKPIRIFCKHSNKEDSLIIDSSAQMLFEKYGEIPYEVNLFDETELTTYELLTRVPLFSVLKSPNLYPGQQKLLVLVIGLGNLGISVVRNAFWMGRMLGVDLRIVGYDKDASSIYSRLRAECPEMMMERNGCIGQHAGKDTTVTLREYDVFGNGFSGRISDDYAACNGAYTVVALGDDNSNLETAMRLQRLSEESLARGFAKQDTSNEISYKILFRVRNPEIKKSVEYLTESGGERYNLVPFGGMHDLYSYDSIIDNPWSKIAIQVAASYQRARKSECKNDPFFQIATKDVLRGYRKFEVKKLSNLTSALHIPYRLWSMGLALDTSTPNWTIRRMGETENDSKIETLSDWLEALEIEPDKVYKLARSYMQPCDKISLADTHPMLFVLSKLEHERWTAFYQSLGWRGIEPSEMLDVANYLGLTTANNPHQSEKLKLHCFVCSYETMLSREAKYEPYKDIAVYDRAFVVDTFQIVTSNVTI